MSSPNCKAFGLKIFFFRESTREFGDNFFGDLLQSYNIFIDKGPNERHCMGETASKKIVWGKLPRLPRNAIFQSLTCFAYLVFDVLPE